MVKLWQKNFRNFWVAPHMWYFSCVSSSWSLSLLPWSALHHGLGHMLKNWSVRWMQNFKSSMCIIFTVFATLYKMVSTVHINLKHRYFCFFFVFYYFLYFYFIFLYFCIFILFFVFLFYSLFFIIIYVTIYNIIINYML